MSKYFALGATWLLAILFIVFGLNKFLGFAAVALPEGAIAQAFLGAMFGSYLVKLVGVAEILGGVLMLVQRTFRLGLLILTPIVLNIAVFHIAHDFIGNGIWLVSLVFFVVVLLLHRAEVKSFFSLLLQPQQ
jgi:uncharacterized membrane protein YphA (DoxX/SURF4 family)